MPTDPQKRYQLIDIVRGTALAGVCFVNAETLFRISLLQHIVEPHTNAGHLNYLVDDFLTNFVEFKAVAVFSFLFGLGIGIQSNREAASIKSQSCFLLRRFSVLLCFGLFHMFLIWDGDILTLYALIGLCVIPLAALSWRWQLIASILALLILSNLPVFNQPLPGPAAMLAHGITATKIYGQGSLVEIFNFRLREINLFIVPLILHIVPKISALIICGMALWHSGLFTKVKDYKSDFWLLRALAATGRMALTNYLMQSIIFSVLFYGYGLGLFAKLSSSETMLIAALTFIVQMIVSEQWLKYFNFGPLEWLWRSLTYGKRFSFRCQS